MFLLSLVPAIFPGEGKGAAVLESKGFPVPLAGRTNVPPWSPADACP